MGSEKIERKKKFFYVVENSEKDSSKEKSGYSGDVIKIDEPRGEIINLTGHQEVIRQMDLYFHRGDYIFNKTNYSMEEIKKGKAIYITLSKDVPGNSWGELLTNLEKQSISSLEGEV